MYADCHMNLWKIGVAHFSKTHASIFSRRRGNGWPGAVSGGNYEVDLSPNDRLHDLHRIRYFARKLCHSCHSALSESSAK